MEVYPVMSIMFFLMVFFGGFAVAGSIFWLAQRSLGGRDWVKRFSLLEAEVKRMAGGQMPQDLEDEVRRLDEKVEFLENLLAERSKPGALPPGGVEESRREPRKP